MPSESRKQTATRETCKNVGGSAYSWAVCFFVVDVYSCFVCAIVSARIASGFVFWFLFYSAWMLAALMWECCAAIQVNWRITATDYIAHDKDRVEWKLEAGRELPSTYCVKNGQPKRILHADKNLWIWEGESIRNTRRIFRRVSFYFVFSLALFSALQATAATLFCVSLAIFDAINKLCRAKYCCKALFMDFEEKKCLGNHLDCESNL